MSEIRLQKFISQAGICSRRKAEDHISNGHVKVNGQIVKTLGTKVDPARDKIHVFNKKAIITKTFIYIALNKPRGIVTSCNHPGEKIVTDLIDLPQRLFPVGRLDKDSSGLLLLTNDGNLHQKISHPSFDHEKKYNVTVYRHISDNDLKQMADGIILNHKKTRKAKVLRTGDKKFQISLKQGRNRQIRRMLGQLNHKVKTLHRIQIDHIHIGNLKSGKWRHLSKKEIKKFENL